jgi:Family of unknown function (DUF6356)
MRTLSFTEHPETVGETYFEHLQVATGFSFQMICGGLACFVHGVFPFLFTTTGSSIVRRLHDRLVLHRTGPRERVAALRADRGHVEAAAVR